IPTWFPGRRAGFFPARPLAGYVSGWFGEMDPTRFKARIRGALREDIEGVADRSDQCRSLSCACAAGPRAAAHGSSKLLLSHSAWRRPPRSEALLHLRARQTAALHHT